MLSRAGVVFMRLLGQLPLPWVRALGWLMGAALYVLAITRRRVVWTNLRLCFPHWGRPRVRAAAFKTFVHFSQAWLDRGWLWHGKPHITRGRLQITGALHELQGSEPVLIFAPHFVGLDAGWTALTQQLPRQFVTLYTHQVNRVVDDWIFEGRKRFGNPTLFDRAPGPKPIVAALRAGQVLYLLPDMNFSPRDSVFVPFYGVQAATVPSLGRFAKLGRAKVVPVLTRLTPGGYEVQVMPAWANYPTQDLMADTATMNERLQGYIDGMPDQYFWVHKRFKHRPPGEPAVY